MKVQCIEWLGGRDCDLPEGRWNLTEITALDDCRSVLVVVDNNEGTDAVNVEGLWLRLEPSEARRLAHALNAAADAVGAHPSAPCPFHPPTTPTDEARS